ncbi:translation elongation factor Ts [Thiococcus pfennigii]|jgi:elongation factor Ts|uniref:translation elongation factor Ts n=1 Tax=Thiococcus pfennigii TaxID=1057 RepID=UPI001906D9FD|nr:translation elongation factor Ts [Thiococcus pfennigii]MBK1701827.1 elongation factor Ts [Thiococcus pfennigii]MBK1730441.1 elongation factor Ts [Thiococcus pfennigii]
MAISAAQVKELRERTGSGMMECKKALTETGGDIEAAIELMRKTGQAKAAKKAGRVAAEGAIMLAVSDDGRRGVLVEVNCETDFVAKDAGFGEFAEAVVAQALASDVEDVEALMALPMAGAGQTLAEAREALIAKIGENIQVRRVVRLDGAQGQIHSYRHGVRIGVLVDVEGGDAEVGKDIAMHIAASRPLCVSADQVDGDALAKEREIFRAQALEEGKPEKIVDKIVEGRVRKYLEEITLLGQPFVKDPDLSVEQRLNQAGAKVARFVRLEVGEGVEKRQENFADEVMAQVRGA